MYCSAYTWSHGCPAQGHAAHVQLLLAPLHAATSSHADASHLARCAAHMLMRSTLNHVVHAEPSTGGPDSHDASQHAPDPIYYTHPATQPQLLPKVVVSHGQPGYLHATPDRRSPLHQAPCCCVPPAPALQQCPSPSSDPECGRHDFKQAVGVVCVYPVPAVGQQVHLVAQRSDALLVIASPPAATHQRHQHRHQQQQQGCGAMVGCQAPRHGLPSAAEPTQLALQAASSITVPPLCTAHPDTLRGVGTTPGFPSSLARPQFVA
jgi:hypothetical protein